MKKFFPFFLTLLYLQSFSQDNPLPEFWQKQLDYIGVFHNEAMEYAFKKIETEKPNMSGTKVDINKIVSTYVGEYYFKRYGDVQGFSLESLQSYIYKTGHEPKDMNTLGFSPALLEAVRKIQDQSILYTDIESFRNAAEETASSYSEKLEQTEKIYLQGYKNIMVNSSEYWSLHLSEWEDLLSKNQGSNQKRKVNGQWVVASDAGGLLSGAVNGCIGGSIFGAVVGCGVGAVFFGAIGAASSSLGNVFAQLFF